MCQLNFSFFTPPAFAVPSVGHRAFGEFDAVPAVVRGGRLAAVSFVYGVAFLFCFLLFALTDEVTAINDCRRLVSHPLSSSSTFLAI